MKGSLGLLRAHIMQTAITFTALIVQQYLRLVRLGLLLRLLLELITIIIKTKHCLTCTSVSFES